MRRKYYAYPRLFLLALAVSASLLVGCKGKLYVIGGSDGWTLETIPIPFKGESKMGKINDDPYRYFRYSSGEGALSDAGKVSEDGLVIGKSRYEWGEPVHFFLRQKRIVIYVGDNQDTVSAIKRVFGKEFAGSSV